MIIELEEKPSHKVHSLKNCTCSFFRGHVIGHPGSSVAMSKCSHWSGLIEREDSGVHVLESVHGSEDHIFYNIADDIASPFSKF